MVSTAGRADPTRPSHYIPNVRSIIQEEITVSQMPSVETMMAKDEASRDLGIELIDQGEGRAVTRMTVRDDMVNGHDMAHGGLIFTLADTAFACACNSFGPVTVAASADIVFVTPARRGCPGGRGRAADPVRAGRALRRNRPPGRRRDRRVPRPQPPAGPGVVNPTVAATPGAFPPVGPQSIPAGRPQSLPAGHPGRLPAGRPQSLPAGRTRHPGGQ
jgi:phenylacetic acid degradation protein PaaD